MMLKEHQIRKVKRLDCFQDILRKQGLAKLATEIITITEDKTKVDAFYEALRKWLL